MEQRMYRFYNNVFLFCPRTLFRIEGSEEYVSFSGCKLYLIDTLFDTFFDFPSITVYKKTTRQLQKAGKIVRSNSKIESLDNVKFHQNRRGLLQYNLFNVRSTGTFDL